MATDLRDVDDLGPLQDAQVHGLVGVFVKVLHERCSDLDQTAFHRGPEVQLEHLAAEPVSLLCPVEQPHHAHHDQIAYDARCRVPLGRPVRRPSSARDTPWSSAVKARRMVTTFPSTVPVSIGGIDAFWSPAARAPPSHQSRPRGCVSLLGFSLKGPLRRQESVGAARYVALAGRYRSGPNACRDASHLPG